MKMRFVFGLGILFLTAGCMTLASKEAKPIKYRVEKAYLKKTRDPRIFGMNMYQTRTGVEIRGGGRLHDWQSVSLPMQAKKPYRPVVSVDTGFGTTAPILLDLTSPLSWLEFNTAKRLKAEAVAERDPVLIRLPDEKVKACLSTVRSLVLDQLYIEYPLVYVRMATGTIGPLSRGIEKPNVKGVVGWDLLHKFEKIQLVYASGKIALSVGEEYEPHPEWLITTIPLLKNTSVCAVEAKVNGKPTTVVIDPAGDFFVATPGGVFLESVELGEGVTLSTPEVSVSPGGIRLGARFLEQYLVTICSTPGEVYFELVPKGMQ